MTSLSVLIVIILSILTFINTPVGGSCTLDILRQTVDGILEEAGDGYRQLLS